MDAEIGIRLGDLFTLILYFVFMLGIGYWCSTRMKGTEGYFVGGRSVPGWAVGISMLGTAISSISFLAYPETGFNSDYTNLIPGFMVPIAAIFGILFFIPFYRRAGLVSVNQYLEMRYAPWARAYGCIMWSLFAFTRMGLILYLLSATVKAMTGYDIYLIIIVMGILVTAYTVMGGIEAVIWTDVMQTIILLLGGLVCIFVACFGVPDGLTTILNEAGAAKKFALSSNTEFSLSVKTLWVMLLFGVFYNLQEFVADQTKVQRYCAAKTEFGAKLSLIIGGIGCIPVWAMFMFVGTCLWVFYNHFPEHLHESISSAEVFPYFILNELPIGVAGFVIAAVLAAAMSSIDSSMNGTATVLTSDIYQRFLVKEKDDNHYFKAARLITFVAGFGMIVLSVFIAYIIDHNILKKDTVLDLNFFFTSLLAGGIGGLFFLGMFTKRCNAQGALVGIVLAVIVSLYMTSYKVSFLPEAYSSPFHDNLITVFSNIVSFVVGYAISLAFPAPSIEKLKDLTVYTYNK